MDKFFAFIDETGILDGSKEIQPYFAVGLLRIGEVALITEELTKRHYDYYSLQKEKRKGVIQNLKIKPKELSAEELNLLLLSTRHYEYKFTKITPTTIEKYKQFLDTAFKFPLHFCVLVIDKNDPNFKLTIYKNYWEAYISYSKLISKYNCQDGTTTIIADYMNRPSASDKYFEKELDFLSGVFRTLRANSESFLLLQLTDLLLGSVVFQWRQANNFVKDSNRAKAKIEFVNYLISKLKIPAEKKNNYPLAQKITCNNPYFSVWPLKLADENKNGGV
ncbi:MAG: DUF3800 domain-containing protein [Patescibacteria group bacterium]